MSDREGARAGGSAMVHGSHTQWACRLGGRRAGNVGICGEDGDGNMRGQTGTGTGRQAV
jgi:hypothetical protein